MKVCGTGIERGKYGNLSLSLSQCCDYSMKLYNVHIIYSQELHLQLENRNLFVLYRQEILTVFTYKYLC